MKYTNTERKLNDNFKFILCDNSLWLSIKRALYSAKAVITAFKLGVKNMCNRTNIFEKYLCKISCDKVAGASISKDVIM